MKLFYWNKNPFSRGLYFRQAKSVKYAEQMYFIPETIMILFWQRLHRDFRVKEIFKG